MATDLSAILFKRYRHLVLELLLLHPDRRYHVREIARMTGTEAGTLYRELRTLADAGLLLRQSVGNQRLYQANPECPVFDELASILKTLRGLKNNQVKDERHEMDALVETNRQQILKLARDNGVRNVRVFGSMARNDAGPDSDLDLLVELEAGKSGLALGGFLADVTELVQRKVEVVTEKSLHPRLREKVLHEAITL